MSTRNRRCYTLLQLRTWLQRAAVRHARRVKPVEPHALDDIAPACYEARGARQKESHGGVLLGTRCHSAPGL